MNNSVVISSKVNSSKVKNSIIDNSVALSSKDKNSIAISSVVSSFGSDFSFLEFGSLEFGSEEFDSQSAQEFSITNGKNWNYYFSFLEVRENWKKSKKITREREYNKENGFCKNREKTDYSCAKSAA